MSLHFHTCRMEFASVPYDTPWSFCELIISIKDGIVMFSRKILCYAENFNINIFQIVMGYWSHGTLVNYIILTVHIVNIGVKHSADEKLIDNWHLIITVLNLATFYTHGDYRKTELG